MASSAAQWTVLGFDTRKIGWQWLGAWKDVLFGPDSPLLKRFDPCVSVIGEDGRERIFQAGLEQSTETSETDNEAGLPQTPFRAIALPESVYLSRIVELPISAEPNLDTVMQLEVNAYSPFPAEETRFGWTVLERTTASLRIGLLIASNLSLAKQLENNSTGTTPELWGFVEDKPVLFLGYGEQLRRRAYLKSLAIAGGLLSVCFAMLLVICAALALVSSSVLDVKAEQLSSVNKAAQPAMALRDRVSILDTLKERINTLSTAHPPANRELARLTGLLADDAYLTDFEMEGRKITIRGRAQDATRVQQQLTSEPAYTSVNAPQSIRKLGDSEVFAFEIQLGEERGE